MFLSKYTGPAIDTAVGNVYDKIEGHWGDQVGTEGSPEQDEMVNMSKIREAIKEIRGYDQMLTLPQEAEARKADVDAEEAARIEAVTNETAARTEAINTVTESLATEVSNREQALAELDADLQSQIDDIVNNPRDLESVEPDEDGYAVIADTHNPITLKEILNYLMNDVSTEDDTQTIIQAIYELRYDPLHTSDNVESLRDADPSSLYSILLGLRDNPTGVVFDEEADVVDPVTVTLKALLEGLRADIGTVALTEKGDLQTQIDAMNDVDGTGLANSIAANAAKIGVINEKIGAKTSSDEESGEVVPATGIYKELEDSSNRISELEEMLGAGATPDEGGENTSISGRVTALEVDNATNKNSISRLQSALGEEQQTISTLNEEGEQVPVVRYVYKTIEDINANIQANAASIEQNASNLGALELVVQGIVEEPIGAELGSLEDNLIYQQITAEEPIPDDETGATETVTTIVTVKDQVGVNEADIVVLDGQMTETRTDIAALDERIVALETEMNDEAGKVPTLEARVATLEEQQTGDETDFESVNARIAELTEAQEAIDGQVATLTEAQETTNTSIAALQSEVDTLNALSEAVAQLQTQLAELSAENQTLAATVNTLTPQLGDIHTTYIETTPEQLAVRFGGTWVSIGSFTSTVDDSTVEVLHAYRRES